MRQNSVQLIGYVGKDPAIYVTKNGDKKAVMNVATHHCRIDEGRKKWVTTWHTIVAWEERADYAERSFLKGSHILVTGSITYRSFSDKTGVDRHLTEIKAESLTNLDR